MTEYIGIILESHSDFELTRIDLSALRMRKYRGRNWRRSYSVIDRKEKESRLSANLTGGKKSDASIFN